MFSVVNVISFTPGSAEGAGGETTHGSIVQGFVQFHMDCTHNACFNFCLHRSWMPNDVVEICSGHR